MGMSVEIIRASEHRETYVEDLNATRNEQSFLPWILRHLSPLLLLPEFFPLDPNARVRCQEAARKQAFTGYQRMRENSVYGDNGRK
jgi:hypothetical protein